MNEAIETLKYEGVTVQIFQDMDDEGPDKWGDDGLFLVAFHRDFCVERKDFDEDLCRSVMTDCLDEYDEPWDYAKEVKKKYHVFGLEAYIHGGVALSLAHEGNFPDRQWDVSQLGCVFVSKKEWRLRKSAKKAAEGHIKTWNEYLRGDVYGYVAEDADGESDSCWGFYGMEYVLEEAKGAAEWLAKDMRKRHENRKKAEIKNHVPLHRREIYS